jgi:hypothetical protein
VQAEVAQATEVQVEMPQVITEELVVTAEAVAEEATTLVLAELAEQVLSIYTIKENL